MNKQIKQLSIIIPAFNAANTLPKLLKSIEKQTLPTGCNLEVIIVNDASTDNTKTILKDYQLRNNSFLMTLINHAENQGRSAARNSGINNATSDYCLLLDSDCYYTNNNVLLNFINNFEKGKQLCFGFTCNNSDSFWGEYQREIYQKRAVSKCASEQTTANFGFVKNLILSAGGFSPKYIKYGFEDRDLILNLLKTVNNEKISIQPSIIAHHNDELSLLEVTNKLYSSARYSAPIFASHHHSTYINSAYGKIDYEYSKNLLSQTITLISKSYRTLLPVAETATRSNIIPYKLKKIIAQIIMGLAYAKGCKDRKL